MVKGFLKILETFNMRAEIVYDKSYSPEDGLVSSETSGRHLHHSSLAQTVRNNQLRHGGDKERAEARQV